MFICSSLPDRIYLIQDLPNWRARRASRIGWPALRWNVTRITSCRRATRAWIKWPRSLWRTWYRSASRWLDTRRRSWTAYRHSGQSSSAARCRMASSSSASGSDYFCAIWIGRAALFVDRSPSDPDGCWPASRDANLVPRGAGRSRPAPLGRGCP